MLGQDRFGVKLNPAYIIRIVMKPHDLSAFVYCCNCHGIGNGISYHRPGMIASYLEGTWQSLKQRFGRAHGARQEGDVDLAEGLEGFAAEVVSYLAP